MRLFRPNGGLRIAGLSLALLSVLLAMLAVTACAPALPSLPQNIALPTAPQPTAVPPTVAAPATAREQAGPFAPGAKASAAPMGVDADGNFYRGDPQAPVKLVEFSDFQCPYCGRHVLQTGPQLEEKYIATGKVVAYFRHFPLSQIHPNALPASKAAYCAGQQAPRFFWDMHGWLFANQTTWSNAGDPAAQFRQAALSFGVDGGRYDACLADPQTEARINRDLQEGAALGVEGTPAFFINDWFLAGAYPFAEFEKVIAKAAGGLHPPPTPTPLPANVEPYDADPTRPGFTYDGSPSLGSPQAPVLIFIFSDFGCPNCVEFAKNIQPTLRARYVQSGQVRLIYKFVAVSAPQTALAALCAAGQGKFWEFSDRLTADQGKWQEGDRAAMVGYAAALGLDAPGFEKCLTDAAGQGQLDADMDLAQQVQVNQVPYFLALNPDAQTGLRIPNLVPLEQFEKIIQDIQKPQAAAPAAGSQPTPAPVAAARRTDLPVGVDADGNFYRGDPRAPIKIVEFSDFQ